AGIDHFLGGVTSIQPAKYFTNCVSRVRRVVVRDGPVVAARVGKAGGKDLKSRVVAVARTYGGDHRVLFREEGRIPKNRDGVSTFRVSKREGVPTGTGDGIQHPGRSTVCAGADAEDYLFAEGSGARDLRVEV